MIRISKPFSLEEKFLLDNPLERIKELIDKTGNTTEIVGEMLVNFLELVDKHKTRKRLEPYSKKLREILEYVERGELLDGNLLKKHRDNYCAMLNKYKIPKLHEI